MHTCAKMGLCMYHFDWNENTKKKTKNKLHFEIASKATEKKWMWTLLKRFRKNYDSAHSIKCCCYFIILYLYTYFSLTRSIIFALIVKKKKIIIKLATTFMNRAISFSFYHSPNDILRYVVFSVRQKRNILKHLSFLFCFWTK